jgi:Domain of unknown function (DUF4349)
MRYTMPAALLLLLFFSCNNRSDFKQKSAVPVVSANTAPSADRAAYKSAAADSSTVSYSSGLAANENVADEQRVEQPAGQPASPRQTHVPTPAANPDWDKKIIKTADLSIETKSLIRFTDRLHRLVRDNGGYIAQEEQTQSAGQIDNSISIKIPVDRFDDLLQQLPADSDRLTDKKVTSQDVSMEVVDTKSRLETKKEVRERYLDLLKQAHKMEDILSIQQEIDGIQEQMDAAAGRIAYLSHSAAFSTINLKFFQVLDPAAETPAPEPTFLHKIKLSFLAGWEFLSALCLGLLTVWPLWLAAVLGYTVWRRHRTRFVQKSA